MQLRWKFKPWLVLVLVGLLGGAAQAQDYDPNGSLTFATNADPTLNPWAPNAVVESNLINELIFEPLVRYNKKDLTPSPGLATSWKVAPDGLSWTFNLRKGVKWSDGKPFTADDVAFTYNNIALNKKLGATGGNLYAPLSKVEVIDPYTVRFVLNTPFSSLPYYLAYFTGILPKHILGDAENPLTLADFNKKNPVGTGPYKVAEFVSGSYVRLVKNDSYWGGPPKVASVVFKIVPDPNTQMAQLLGGELDMVTVTNPALLAGIERNPKLKLIRQNQNIYYFVALNQNDPRFKDVRVRQALLYAIDRKAIIDAVLKGYGEIATGPIAPLQKLFYRKDVPSYAFDPKKAQELLKQAGWVPGPDGVLTKDGKPLEIDMPTGQFGYLVPATLLVQQYWKAIGVKANVKVMEWNAYIQQMFVNRQYQATLAWWSTPPTPDVSPYYQSSSADKGQNIPNFKSAELDKLLEDGRKATSLRSQVLAYLQMQRFVAEQLPYLYLWYPDILTVRDDKIGGMVDLNQAVAFQYASEWFVKR
ncbi:MAG: ABC transporter substrate-binding protein [Thermaceae bacterium]|nr:ABC transporter substrate-binding protein [Thermaceae bacterium]